jgi:formyl-CoA transferase
MDEVFADPQIRDRKMQVQLDHPTAGELSLLASPLNIPTEPVQIRCPPPTLGQHTRDILQGMLSYSEGRIESLRRDGVI